MSFANNNALFIFRRDLRVQDNTALAHALASSKKVLPCFIFDPRQIGQENSYRSENALQFMVDSLVDLEEQLKKYKAKLYFFYGKAEDVVEQLLRKKVCDAVYCNRDYTPFSLQRDDALKRVCTVYSCTFELSCDLLLHEPEDIVTTSGTPYTVFTPFFKNAAKLAVRQPCTILQAHSQWCTDAIPGALVLEEMAQKIAYTRNKNIAAHGGTTQAIKILKNIERFKEYKKTRDYPALATTGLSPHLKFGTVSIRSVYYAIQDSLGTSHPLLQQLYWRDFFTHVAYHSPFVFGAAYREKYNNLWWSNNKEHFERWCTGTTGFPIVDAGMRQLNETGFMHNRVRMITASFLVKDLHIDWRMGEHYFATRLVDYDPAVNNGNWQWAASTGCDAQPYFRIFNPWLQQKKFDPACEYIKTWVPELKTMSPALLHSWNVQHAKIKHEYYAPIIDHAQESKRAKELYKKV